MTSIQPPEGSSIIEDAEEEIFYIYTILQSAPSQDLGNMRGLGFLDNKTDLVELRFDLVPPVLESGIDCRESRKRKKTKKKEAETLPRTFEYQLLQDKTALRSRSGDTGSVVWKASVDFARYVLQEHTYPSERSLFNFAKLKESNVVELGAGTGLLSLIFAPLVKTYTATDHPDLVHLIEKNVKNQFPGWPNNGIVGSAGQNVTVTGLDWIDIERSTGSQRLKLLSGLTSSELPIDLLLVVDCIYHPSLIAPLVATIDRLSTTDVTDVLVLSELRSEEVLRQFLGAWMEFPGWTIWHVEGNILQDVHYVMWVGRKSVAPRT